MNCLRLLFNWSLYRKSIQAYIFKRIIGNCNSELTKGLLYGYGKKNALMWSWWQNDSYPTQGRVEEYLKTDPLSSSRGKIEIREGELARTKIQIGSGPDNFDIPFFAKIEEDEQSIQYKKEKKKIAEIYRGKDLVEVTLKRLSS